MSKYGIPGEFVALPDHEPCGVDGCGAHNAQSMDLVCVATRAFGKVVGAYAHGTPRREHIDRPGCGATFVLSASSGQRERAP